MLRGNRLEQPGRSPNHFPALKIFRIHGVTPSVGGEVTLSEEFSTDWCQELHMGWCTGRKVAQTLQKIRPSHVSNRITP